jgi:hypothetical protein
LEKIEYPIKELRIESIKCEHLPALYFNEFLQESVKELELSHFYDSGIDQKLLTKFLIKFPNLEQLSCNLKYLDNDMENVIKLVEIWDKLYIKLNIIKYDENLKIALQDLDIFYKDKTGKIHKLSIDKFECILGNFLVKDPEFWVFNDIPNYSFTDIRKEYDCLPEEIEEIQSFIDTQNEILSQQDWYFILKNDNLYNNDSEYATSITDYWKKNIVIKLSNSSQKEFERMINYYSELLPNCKNEVDLYLIIQKKIKIEHTKNFLEEILNYNIVSVSLDCNEIETEEDINFLIVWYKTLFEKPNLYQFKWKVKKETIILKNLSISREKYYKLLDKVLIMDEPENEIKLKYIGNNSIIEDLILIQ